MDKAEGNFWTGLFVGKMLSGKNNGSNDNGGCLTSIIGWIIIAIAFAIGSRFGATGLIVGVVVVISVIIFLKTKSSQRARVNKIAEEAQELVDQGNYTLALEKAESVAEKNSDAADLAGLLYLNGEGCDVNVEKAFKYFEMGKKNMDARAHYAMMLLNGQGCSQNIELGRSELKFAADVGKNPLAIMRVGEFQISGEVGFEKNVEQGMKNLRIAMDQGYPYAMYLVGKMQFTGTDGVPVNKEKGIELLQKAAENGVRDAADFLESLNK